MNRFIRWLACPDFNTYKYEEHLVFDINKQPLIVNIRKGVRSIVYIPAGCFVKFSYNELCDDGKCGFYAQKDNDLKNLHRLGKSPNFSYVNTRCVDSRDEKSSTLYLSYYNRDITIYFTFG